MPMALLVCVDTGEPLVNHENTLEQRFRCSFLPQAEDRNFQIVMTPFRLSFARGDQKRDANVSCALIRLEINRLAVSCFVSGGTKLGFCRN